MIQTLNPSKTDEIMSRYRPIAPKPELPSLSTNFDTNGGGAGGGSSVVVPEKFRQSPYLRNIWSHLQARPTRTRKRAARSSTPIPLRKHHKIGGAAPPFLGFCSPSHLASPTQNLSYQGFTICDYDDPNCHRNHYPPPPPPPNSDDAVNNVAIDKPIITLPLLSCAEVSGGGERNPIDLNAAVAEGGGLEERDLLLQLQVPSPNKNNAVISPRPIRPVGSSISVVGPMSEDPEAQAVVKRAEEVEDAAEAEAFPVVISDRSNKVRMANSAYKELMGQPECPWLDSMMMSSSSSSSSRPGKRISGEVMLHVPGMPVSGNGFSCWVRIEWASGGNKSCVNAFCNVVRLVCESKDYMFSWRFHTREVSPSASKV